MTVIIGSYSYKIIVKYDMYEETIRVSCVTT